VLAAVLIPLIPRCFSLLLRCSAAVIAADIALLKRPKTQGNQ
jgi:hypothetical protein